MNFVSAGCLNDQQGNSQIMSRDWEVNTMAASIYVELESGRSAGRVHPHNGYYAGDFSQVPMPTPAQLTAMTQLRPVGFDPVGSR